MLIDDPLLNDTKLSLKSIREINDKFTNMFNKRLNINGLTIKVLSSSIRFST